MTISGNFRWSPDILAVVWLPCSSCWVVVLQSLGIHPTIFRQPSGSCQAAVRQLSDSWQAVVRQLAGSWQAVIKQSSGRQALDEKNESIVSGDPGRKLIW